MAEDVEIFGSGARSRALALLTRLAQRQAGARPLLERAMRGRLEHLAGLAGAVLQETADPLAPSDPFGTVLTGLLREKGLSFSLARTLFQQIPLGTVSLREVTITVTRRLLAQELSRPDPDLHHLSELHHTLSTGLLATGWTQEALEEAEKAIRLLRNLPEGGTRTPRGLDVVLANLARVRLDSGDIEEGSAAAEEAVALARTRDDTLENHYYLGLCLAVQSRARQALGQRHDALASAEEATRHLRQVRDRSVRHFGQDLAESLAKLASCYFDLEQFEQAHACAGEAVSILRDLRQTSPDVFTISLASALDALGTSLGRLGRFDAAFAAHQEAVEISRALARAHPDAFKSNLAVMLNNLGLVSRQVGRLDEAISAVREAAGLFRDLAAIHPRAFAARWAESMGNLAGLCVEADSAELGREVADIALGIYRRLAVDQPEAFRENLAAILVSLAIAESELGAQAQARAAIEEALGIYEGLAASYPDAFTSRLARAASTASAILDRCGCGQEALRLQQRAVALFRRLVRDHGNAYRPRLAIALHNLAQRYARVGARCRAAAAASAALHLAARSPAIDRELWAEAVHSLEVRLDSLPRGPGTGPVAPAGASPRRW